MTIRLTLAVCALVLAAPLGADTIRLKDGSVREGKILKQDDREVLLEVSVGRLKAQVRIARSEIRSIDAGETENERLLKQIERRRASVKSDDAEGWFRFAESLKRQPGFEALRRDAYAKVVAIDPKHAQAHLALGHVKVDGAWKTLDEYMADKGLVRYRNRYVTPEERNRLAAREAEIRRAVDAEIARAQRGEPVRTAEEERERQVARELRRERVPYRGYRHRDTVLGRLGYYDAYPTYGGAPILSGTSVGGSFYGTVGYPYGGYTSSSYGYGGVPYRSTRISPGFIARHGDTTFTFGTNFGGGFGGYNINLSGSSGSLIYNLNFGGGSFRFGGGSSTTILGPSAFPTR